jgi:Putative prokaryotic signal transducing protein
MPSSSSSSGRLVKVGHGQNRVEAEMIQGLLFEQRIPSLLSQPGLGAPYNVTAGPHHVLVAEEDAARAREVLEGIPGVS